MAAVYNTDDRDGKKRHISIIPLIIRQTCISINPHDEKLNWNQMMQKLSDPGIKKESWTTLESISPEAAIYGLECDESLVENIRALDSNLHNFFEKANRITKCCFRFK